MRKLIASNVFNTANQNIFKQLPGRLILRLQRNPNPTKLLLSWAMLELKYTVITALRQSIPEHSQMSEGNVISSVCAFTHSKDR
jgi:hypothetical protein